MSEITKAAFYKNWYDIAQSLEENQRLKFYEMIFNYYFCDIKPAEEENNLLFKTLFLAIQANIDADKKRKNGGAPLGNKNAEIQKQPKKQPENNLEKTTETNKVKVKVNVKDNVNDKVKVKGNENYFTTYFSNPTLKITEFEDKNGLHFPKKTQEKLLELLPEFDLDERLKLIKEKYPAAEGDELIKLFTASLSWKNLKNKKPEETKTIKVKPPKTCAFCGGKLSPGAMPNSVECLACLENGKRTFWELCGDQWQCSRQ